MPRRGGGWLSQRDERKCTIVRPLVSSSRAQPRDLSCRQENRTYEEVRHSKSYEVRCLSLPSHFLSDRCARKISRFARNDNTGKGGTLIFRPCDAFFPLSFIPPVPYPPLRGTFPMRGRLCSSALVFPRILYSLWRYRIMACRASILRKQKPLCEDELCRAVSSSIIPRSRILRDFSAYPHHFLS